MKNTIAIGIPDKVSAAERDRNSAISKLHDSIVKRKSKVIEFDLPKWYSAEDAYTTGLYLHYSILRKSGKYLLASDIMEHFGIDHIDWYCDLDQKDRANFYLLLAAANGHKLE